MGFKIPSKKLKFEDPDYANFDVFVRGLSIGDLRSIAGFVDLNEEDGFPDDAVIQKLCQVLGKAIIAWNLDDDLGQPVKPSAEAVATLPFSVIEMIMNATLDALSLGNRNGGQAPDPLSRPSSDGALFPVESIPMEMLSPNL